MDRIITTFRDLYTRFSEWVNTSSDANVIAWVSTVFFSAFVIFLLRIPQRVYRRFFKRKALSHDEQIMEKNAITNTGGQNRSTLVITIPPDVDLVGRDTDIKAIRELLKKHNIVSIQAYSGVGKTAIATKIANEIKDEIISGESPYQYIAWITSTGDLEADLTGINIPSVVSAKTIEEKLIALRMFFDCTSTFLIIDNMDASLSKGENRLLNTISDKVKILITTTVDISISKPYLLTEIDQDSAMLLLYRHYKRDNDITINQIKKRDDVSFAEQIVVATGKNALFIELIGKMAFSEKKNLRDLWELLKDNVFDKGSTHNISTDHTKSHCENEGRLLTSVQNLYNMSTLSDKQKEIMSFIALFPAEHSIFFDVFKWAGFEDDKEDHLGALQDRGWIDRDDEGYLIHTLVQDSVKWQSGKGRFDEERYENLIVELADTDQYIPEGTVFTKVRERIVVPETVCRLLVDNGSEKENTATLFNNLAGVYYAQGNYEKALEYFEKALVVQEEVLGKEHPSTATTYNNIAVVYSEQGDHEEALKYYKEALVIREKVQGDNHPDVASSYNNLGIVYSKQGSYEEALKYYKKALAIRENVLGEDHPNTAATYNNIAEVYSALGDYENAFKYYEKALVIIERVLGKEHPSTATIYSNMGNVYRAQGRNGEALRFYERALRIRENVLGEDHPATAGTYNNIAVVYSEQGDHEEAQKYYKKALAIREKVLGEDHPDTAATYNNLAVVYLAQGNYEKALKYYEKALVIQEEVLGKEHPDTAVTYNNLAGVYKDQGNYEKALEYYEKALVIKEEVLGKEHPSTATTYNNMAGVYYSQGNYEGALEYYEKALKIFDEKLGPEHPYTKSVRKYLEETKKALTSN